MHANKWRLITRQFDLNNLQPCICFDRVLNAGTPSFRGVLVKNHM